MYNKLFAKIVDSSIWLESDATRLVWLTMIAVMDEDGFVSMASPINLARRANVSVPKCHSAIAVLEAPDPHSSDPDHEGRRIEHVPGGWVVLNATKYRELVARMTQRESNRKRVKRFRDARNEVVADGNGQSVTGNDVKRFVTQSEAVSEAEANTEAEKTTTTTLIVSPIQFEKAHKSFAFFGSRLKVPHVLHRECRDKLGGDDPEVVLQGWYLTLNDSAEESKEPIPDVFPWLRAKFIEWVNVAYARPGQSRTPRVSDRDAEQLRKTQEVKRLITTGMDRQTAFTQVFGA